MTATPPRGLNSGGAGASLDRHDAHDARDLEGVAVVVARDGAAVHRRPRDDGVEHPVEPRVDAVLRLAGRDVAAVDQLQLALADVAELRRDPSGAGSPGRERAAGPPPWRAPRSPGAVRSRRGRPRGSSPAPRRREPSTARPPPPPAWRGRRRRSAASGRRSGGCCASRRCPGCRSAPRRPAPARPARASSRPPARRRRSSACRSARPVPSRSGGRRWSPCRRPRWRRRRGDCRPSRGACRPRRTWADRPRARRAGIPPPAPARPGRTRPGGTGAGSRWRSRPACRSSPRRSVPVSGPPGRAS